MIEFTPSITQTTTTDDLIAQMVTAVQDGARTINLGRFMARWEGGAWFVHDGCEDRLTIGGLLLAVPVIVRCWLKDNWDLNS